MFQQIWGSPHRARWSGWMWMWVWVGGGVSTKLKSSNRIVISWFIKFLLTSDWFQGSPRLWGLGVGGGGSDSVRVFGGCLKHVCTCIHTHVHAWAMMSQWDSPGFPYDSSYLHEIIMFIHVCMCTHVCMHVHVCGAPPNTLTECHPHPPTPTTQGGTPEISQKSIKIEQITIFEFCSKILDLWTFVHSYRLHLVCRWGVSHHK